MSANCFMVDVRANLKGRDLKERVRAFWQEHPCGTKFSDAEVGTQRFYEAVEEHRYRTEWHIPEAAANANAKLVAVCDVKDRATIQPLTVPFTVKPPLET